MCSRAQWWLVITSPLDDTNDAEHPLPNRSAPRRAFVRHSSSGVTPWASWK